MNSLSLIPHADRDRYGRLPEGLKIEFTEWATCAIELSATTRMPGALVKAWATRLHVSESTLRQKVGRWKQSGDWLEFVNCAKAGPEWWESDASPLSANREFVEWFQGWCGRNQRKWRPQIRAFYRRWEAWLGGDETKRFPGFDACPPDAGQRSKRHPAGMSQRNLYTLLKKQPRAEVAMMRIGTAAALEHLPGCPLTRVGVRPLEFVFFDDVWLDRKVIVEGYRAPVRLLQLGCVDFASGVYLMFGQRPELPQDDGTKERLKERDMKWLVARLLESFGFPADYYMHLIVERGTATLREADARALYDLSDGRIRVCYTSMEGELVLTWQEAKSGCARGKAPLESWHNLFHNEQGALPGQMGMDRAHVPAALPGMEREAMALQTASHFLTPEQRARLGYPFSDWRAAYFETQEVVNRMNQRRDHELEGFEKMPIWRLPGVQMDWRPDGELLNVAEPLRDHVEWSTRTETPMERLARLSAGLRFEKIPASVLPRFYDDAHVLAKIDDFGFSFKKDGRTYTYYPPTPEQSLPEGNEYLAYYRPFDFGVIHLTEQTNHGPRYVATWSLQERGRRGDLKAAAKAMQFKQGFLQETMAAVRRKHQEAINEQEARVRGNLQVLAEADLIPSTLDNPLPTARREAISATAAALQEAVTEHGPVRRAEKAKSAQQFDDETDAALRSAVEM